MRYLIPILVLALAACSGGGAAAPALESAALEGMIYELDGQTLDRSGVSVTVVETGERVLTSTDGMFEFASVPPGDITLHFDAAAISLADSDDVDPERAREREEEQERVEEGEGDMDRDMDRDRDSQEDDSDDADEDDEDGDGVEDDDAEDDDDDKGEPRLIRVRERERVRIRCAMEDGEISEFSCESMERHRARARLERAEGSPDPDCEGKVRVRSEDGKEEFEVEVENLAAGTMVEIFLDDPADEAGFESVGTATANSEGEAEFERDTSDGDRLPFGVDGVAELAGYRVQVRVTNGGGLLLHGEVPDMPDNAPLGDGSPGAGEDGRGKAQMASVSDDHVGCEIEVRSRPDRGEERFRMEAEYLAPGTAVRFEIENPDNGEFVRFARAVADEDGEAEANTQDGASMPLGADGVRELVGLQVRVVLDDESGRVLCAGFVPALVAD
jgi:hypothetical protein